MTLIACSLDAATQRERFADMAELARSALRGRTPIGGGERLAFAGGEDVRRRLEAIVAAESRCCSFLAFDLRGGDAGELLLEVTGPAEAQPVVAAFFAG